MHDLPDGLRDGLRRLDAHLLLGVADPGTAVWLACDLLLAGVESPAVVELAGESATGVTLVDSERLIRQMLTELGVEPVHTIRRATWLVAGDLARQMIAGTLAPEDGARSLWALARARNYDDVTEMYCVLLPLEAWDETPPGQRDDQAIRADMLQAAHAVVRAADAELAPPNVPH